MYSASSLLAIGALLPYLAIATPIDNINLARWQSSNASTTTTTATAGSFSSPLPATPIRPTTAPTETGSTTLDLTFAAHDVSLGEAPILGVAITPSCLDCSTWGNLTLSATDFGFRLGDDLLSSPENQTSDSGFTGGNVRASACGVGGRMLFQLEAAEFSHTFTLPFKPPIAGFSLPGVGTIGAFLQFDVDLSLSLPEPATVSFGFDFALPEGAFVDVDFSDLANSTTYGFEPSEGLVVDAIPFSTDLGRLDGNVTAEAKLRTSLLFGLTGFDIPTIGGEKVGIDATAGVFLDLPTLTVEGALLENVGEDCQKGVTEGADGQLHYLASALNIEPSVGAAVGLELTVELPGLPDINKETTLLDVSVPLPTACVAL